MIFSLDRVTEGLAVLISDARERLEIPANKLPPSAKEGDCLVITGDGRFAVDEAETSRRKKLNADIFKKLIQ